MLPKNSINIQTIARIAIMVFLAAVLGLLIANLQFTGIALIVFLPITLVMGGIFAKQPKIAIYSLVFMGFVTSALSRYYPGPPYGLSIDVLLVLGLIIVFIKDFKQLDTKALGNDLTLAWGLWMLFCILMIFNPLAPSLEAWFYAVRGIGLYPLLMIPLVLMVFKKAKDMHRLFVLIIIMEVIGALWGMKQVYMGVSPTENRWLAAGAASTHILFGKLRAFSYFSDAAQFGASQVHMAFMCFACAFGVKKNVYRTLLILAGTICFYGFMLSGSRGPLIIPVVAGLVFLFLSRYTKLLIAGLLVGFLAFGFLKFTTIGQSNYNIARLRTALNPSEDASYLVRKAREQEVAVYLQDKPLGGGIGSAGFWGRRFSPGTFLAEIGTDGHYTRIWMETGIVGLILYLLLLGWLCFRIILICYRLKDPSTRFFISAWGASFVGLCVASYTNGLLVQLPTGPIVYCGLAFVWMARKWDKSSENLKNPDLETVS